MANKTVKVNEESQVRAGSLGTILASLAGGPKWSTPLEAGVGIVQSITGPLVDNTDPKNPVIIPGAGLGDMASNIYDPANGARQVAFDDEVVKLSDDQTIANVKTFSSSPIVPTPTTDYQASTKKYVDDSIGGIPGSPVVSVNTRTGAVTGLAEVSDLTAHTGDTNNPHNVTKAQVGLDNVDNTSDANKPLSTAATTALAGKANTSHTHAADDVTSGTLADARIPSLNASKITAGTMASARLGSGTANAGTVLHGDGTWKTAASGTGDVVGPASSISNSLAMFSGTTGKLIEGSASWSLDAASGSLIGPTGAATDSNLLLVSQVRANSIATTAGASLIAVEDIATTSNAKTLTNKRIDPRVSSTTSGSSLTPTIASYDQYVYTALAANLTINAPTGTPVDGNKLLFRIKDNGTARTLTWDAIFRAIGVTLPTTTVASKTMYVGAVYNAAETKWDIIAVTKEA